MRLAAPTSDRDSELAMLPPNSSTRPVGWEQLPQLGSAELSINTKFLLKCPHRNRPSARLPPGR